MSVLNLTRKKLVAGAAIPAAVAGQRRAGLAVVVLGVLRDHRRTRPTTGPPAPSPWPTTTATPRCSPRPTSSPARPAPSASRSPRPARWPRRSSSTARRTPPPTPGRQHQPQGRGGHRRHHRQLRRLHRRHSTLYDGTLTSFGTTKTSFATGVGTWAPTGRQRDQVLPDHLHAERQHPGHRPGRHRGPRLHLGVPEQLIPAGQRTGVTTTESFTSQMSIHDPSPAPGAGPGRSRGAPAPVAELGWGRVLRVAVARAALAMVASLVLWSLLPLLAGWTPRVIMSGSMEPRIHVRRHRRHPRRPGREPGQGPGRHRHGPRPPRKTRTHRLLRREADGTLVTKGDANPQADSSRSRRRRARRRRRPGPVRRAARRLAGRAQLARPRAPPSCFLGWCLVTVLPGSRRSEDTAGDDGRRSRAVAPTTPRHAAVRAASPRPSPSPRSPWAPPPARPTAAFSRDGPEPDQQLAAASTFYPYRTAVLGGLAVPLLAARRDQRHRRRRRRDRQPPRHDAPRDLHLGQRPGR